MNADTRSTSPRRAAPASIALALTLLVVAGTPALAAQTDEPAVAVARLLDDRPEPDVDPDELAADLARAGSADVLLDALSGELLLRHPLRGARREAVLEALARLPRTPLVETLAELSRRDEATTAERAACIEVLGRVGRAGEVGMLLRAGEPRADHPREPEVERAFEAALGDLLDRRPALCEAVAAQMREADPSLLLPLVRQLGRPRTPRQLELLVAQLGRVPGADVLLLGEVERLARGASLEVARRARPPVRDQLDSHDLLVCIAACRAVEALEDTEAVEPLIVLLGSDQPALQAAARAALERLTRQDLGPAPEAWSAWYRAELAWWRGEARSHLLAVRSGAARELSPALMGLARGTLFREEIAPALADLLRHPDPDVARLTASVLASLGTRAALPALADALAHADPGVAAGAHKALRRITGRDLGSEPDAWLALPH